MSRLVNYLIEDVRSNTENNEFSDTIGIGDEEILQFLNDAQRRLHARIVNQHPSVFVKEKIISSVKDQDVYNLPENSFMGNKVTQIEYNDSGDDYYPLKPTILRNRMTGVSGDPCKYIRKSGQIILVPAPNSSNDNIKISYVAKLPKLEKRRGQVSEITLDTVNKTIVTMSLDTATSVVDSTVNKDNFISVVDRNGNIKMAHIEIDSINESTGEVFITSGFSYTDTETIEVGDYVVSGTYSSTHSELDDYVERYLISYANLKVLKRDSSVDASEAFQELAEMEQEIIAAYADITDDITEIPELTKYDIDSWGW